MAYLGTQGKVMADNAVMDTVYRCAHDVNG